MKGRILGCDSSGCVINTESGERFRFGIDEWKGQRPPQPRDEVDFVGTDGAATEVFPSVAGAAFVAPSIDSDAGRKAVGILRDRPQVILAAVVLIAAFFLNFIQIGGVIGEPVLKATAVALPGKVAAIRAAAQDGLNQLSHLLLDQPGATAGDPGLNPPTSEAAEAKAKFEQAKAALAMSQLVVVLYLIPVGAAAILFLEYRNRRNRLLELATGALGVAAVAATFYAREVAADYMNRMLGSGVESFKQAFQIGPGGWLIGLCGVGLLCTGLGYLRRTPGLPG